jgi:D-alanyl-D-alanine carboxypeptidase
MAGKKLFEFPHAKLFHFINSTATDTTTPHVQSKAIRRKVKTRSVSEISSTSGDHALIHAKQVLARRWEAPPIAASKSTASFPESITDYHICC